MNQEWFRMSLFLVTISLSQVILIKNSKNKENIQHQKKNNKNTVENLPDQVKNQV
jgi:hypothetical protein